MLAIRNIVCSAVLLIYTIASVKALFKWGPKKHVITWLATLGGAIALLLLSLGQFIGSN